MRIGLQNNFIYFFIILWKILRYNCLTVMVNCINRKPVETSCCKNRYCWKLNKIGLPHNVNNLAVCNFVYHCIKWQIAKNSHLQILWYTALLVRWEEHVAFTKISFITELSSNTILSMEQNHTSNLAVRYLLSVKVCENELKNIYQSRSLSRFSRKLWKRQRY